jgi:hypothetical protein
MKRKKIPLRSPHPIVLPPHPLLQPPHVCKIPISAGDPMELFPHGTGRRSFTSQVPPSVVVTSHCKLKLMLNICPRLDHNGPGLRSCTAVRYCRLQLHISYPDSR